MHKFIATISDLLTLDQRIELMIAAMQDLEKNAVRMDLSKIAKMHKATQDVINSTQVEIDRISKLNAQAVRTLKTLEKRYCKN